MSVQSVGASSTQYAPPVQATSGAGAARKAEAPPEAVRAQSAQEPQSRQGHPAQQRAAESGRQTDPGRHHQVCQQVLLPLFTIEERCAFVINNILSEDDKNTLLRAANGEIIPSFDLNDIAKLRDSLSAYDRQFFDCIAFLIANNRIEILVVEPNSGRGISHTKSGIFFDGKNYVAFNGSCNFTKTALIDNIESVDAYCDWDGGIFVAKIDNIIHEFKSKYEKIDDTVRYVDPTDIIVSIQNLFKEKEISELLKQEKDLIEKEINYQSLNSAN